MTAENFAWLPATKDTVLRVPDIITNGMARGKRVFETAREKTINLWKNNAIVREGKEAARRCLQFGRRRDGVY